MSLALLIARGEVAKRTNTGLLAARCVVGSDTFVVGAMGQPVDYARVVAEKATNLVLFPGPAAVPLTAAFAASLPRPLRLIVPDGHWGQAAKLRKKLPAGVIDVALSGVAPNPHPLRRAARGIPDGVATIEAIAHAFEVLAGKGAGAPLMTIYGVFVQRLQQERRRGGI